MAFTNTLIKHFTLGPDRAVLYQVSADAASGMVQTPLSYVDGFTWAPISMTAVTAVMRANLNDSSATANGTVFVSSVAAADLFYLVVYGRS